MAEEIIKARVWTKVDTLENWNNNPLLLGPGEMALVTTPSGIPLNMKWGDKNERKRFSDLPFAISYDQGQFVAIDGPGALPTPESDVAYSLVGPGTYTYPGQADIVVDEGHWGQVVYNDGEWSFVDMGELPQTEVHDGFDLESATIGGSANNDAWLYKNIHVESGVEIGVLNKEEGESYQVGRTVIDTMFPFTKSGGVTIQIGHKGLSAGKLIILEKVTDGLPENITFKTISVEDVNFTDGINTLSTFVTENTYFAVFSENSWFWNQTGVGGKSYYRVSGDWADGEEYNSFESARSIQYSYQYNDLLIKDALVEVIDSQKSLSGKIDDVNTVTEGTKVYGKQSVEDVATTRTNLRLAIDINPLSESESNITLKDIDIVSVQDGDLTICYYEKIGEEFHLRSEFETTLSGTGIKTITFPENFIIKANWHQAFASVDGQAKLGAVNAQPVNSSMYNPGGKAEVVTGQVSYWDFEYTLRGEASKTINEKFAEVDDRISKLDGGVAKPIIYAELNGSSPTVNESGWYRCCPVVRDTDENGTVLGCTGAYWDSKRDRFIVSEFAMGGVSARLLVFQPDDLVDRDLDNPQVSQSIKEFDLIEHIRLVQGCWWDYITDTYNIVGSAVDGSGYTIVKLNPETGSLVDKLNVSFIGSELLGLEPGMFDLDENDNILFKPNNSSDLYVLDRNTYFPVKKTPTLYHEGLAANKFTREIWVANQNNLIRKYDKNLNQLAEFEYNTFDNENGGSNVEGMIVYKDGSIIMSADCFLHSPPSGPTVLGNALYFFDFEKTVNKRLYFDPLKQYIGDGVMYSEILKVDSGATEIVSSVPIRYRSGNTVQELLSNQFSETFTTGNYIQISY